MPHWLPPAVLSMLALTVVAPFLSDAGYWISDAEWILISGGALLVGLCFGVVLNRSAKALDLLASVLVYWVLDFYLFFEPWVPIAVGVAVLVALWSRWRASVLLQLLAFSIIFVVLTVIPLAYKPLFTPAIEMADSKRRLRDDLPPVIHLILDEQVALRSMPPPPDRDRIDERMEADYQALGFRLYDQTRAASEWTRRSLGRVFALGTTLPWQTNVRDHPESGYFKIQRNAYLERLDALEPLRKSRRLHHLREWSHDQSIEVFPGSAGARGPDGGGARGAAHLAVGGDRIDCGQDRMHG